MHRPLWILVVLLLIAPTTAFGQNRGSVAGVVTTSGGEPLPGAQVIDPALQRGTTTDASGQFRLTGLPTGPHTLEIRYVGYQTAVREVDVEAGATTSLDVTLKQRVLQSEGVTVTGTARARSTLRAPQDVDVIDAAALAVERSAALGDLLAERVGGVASIQTGSQAGKPVLRGLSGNRILLLKDGVAQEYYQFGVRHFPTTNASEAERVEVVRGASSILYGSDALGGAINVLTRSTPTADPGAVEVGGHASGQYFTNNDERSGTLELHGARGPVGVRVGVERRVGGDYTAPDTRTFFDEGAATGTYGDPKYDGTIPFTNFDQWSGYGQIGYRGDFGSVQAFGDYWSNQHNFLLPDGGPDDDNAASPPVRGLGQNLEHGNVLLKGTLLAGDFVLKPRLGFQRSIRQSGAPGTSLDSIDARGGVSDFDYPLDLKTDVYTGRLEIAHPSYGAWSGTVGAEVQHQDADTRGPAELQPSATTTTAGVFVFEEADYNPLTLSAGARLDVRTVDAVPNERTTDPDALESTYTTLAGALGASFVVADGVVLASNLSSGFRAPSVFELYASGVHGGVAAFQVGDPDLEPERAYSADLSLRLRRDRLTGEVTAYVNAIRNYVYLANTGETNPGSGLPVYAASQTDARLGGIEATVEGSLAPWLQLGLDAAWIDGTGDGLSEDGSDDGALPLLPASTVGGFVKWLPGDTGVVESPFVEASLHHAFDKDAAGRYEPFSQFDAGFGPPFGTASTEAYTTVDLSAGATLALGLGAPLTLSVDVRNVFDATYRDFLDTYKGYALSPGRDVRMTLSTRF